MRFSPLKILIGNWPREKDLAREGRGGHKSAASDLSNATRISQRSLLSFLPTLFFAQSSAVSIRNTIPEMKLRFRCFRYRRRDGAHSPLPSGASVRGDFSRSLSGLLKNVNDSRDILESGSVTRIRAEPRRPRSPFYSPCKGRAIFRIYFRATSQRLPDANFPPARFHELDIAENCFSRETFSRRRYPASAGLVPLLYRFRDRCDGCFSAASTYLVNYRGIPGAFPDSDVSVGDIYSGAYLANSNVNNLRAAG